jgi:hypothetical protein
MRVRIGLASSIDGRILFVLNTLHSARFCIACRHTPPPPFHPGSPNPEPEPGEGEGEGEQGSVVAFRTPSRDLDHAFSEMPTILPRLSQRVTYPDIAS